MSTSRISFYMFVCFVCVLHVSSGSILQVNMVKDDVAAPQEVKVWPEVSPDDDLVPVPVEITLEESSEKIKKCAKVGEFCMSHAECCTHSCLGYMKRCVT